MHHSAQRYIEARRHFGIRDDAVDGGRDLAQVFSKRADIDVDGTAQFIVVHFGGRGDAGDVADHIEPGGGGRAGSTQRDGLKVSQSLNLVFGVLNGQHIIVAGLWIDPITRRYHLIGRQRRDHIVDHLALIETHLAGPCTVDIELQRGVVDILGYEYVGDAWNSPNPRGELEGGVIGPFEIGAGHLDIDGRRKAQIQDRVDHTAGLKIHAQLRQVSSDFLFYPGHILVAPDFVFRVQADLHERGVHG